jgi:hypothetical protein
MADGEKGWVINPVQVRKDTATALSAGIGCDMYGGSDAWTGIARVVEPKCNVSDALLLTCF